MSRRPIGVRRVRAALPVPVPDVVAAVRELVTQRDAETDRAERMPLFVEWLMGYPTEWTDAPPDACAGPDFGF